MNNSLTEVFFYGLFMDKKHLIGKGITPENIRKASLANYGLIIGQRASLVHAPEERVYGVIMTIKSSDVNTLYSDKTVIDYVPEKVTVVTDQNEAVEAICYNLPKDLIAGSNVTYAKSLLELARSLDFPKTYIAHIKKFLVEYS